VCATPRTRSPLASGERATVLAVLSASAASDLTAEELAALRSAGAWYAKYHAARMAELADDPSAHALRRKEGFLTLVEALRKLGFDMALPDGLRQIERQAA
jgi:hypothetical protein